MSLTLQVPPAPATSWDDMPDDLDFDKTPQAVAVTAATNVHPFEAKGLGKAPYDCTGMRLSGGSHCDYCGTFIKNEYTIKSRDGRSFVVGSDCVMKTQSQTMRGFKEAKRGFERQQREALKARKATEWAEENPEATAWIEQNRASFAFAESLYYALQQYGSLTDGQLNAIESCKRKSAERQAAYQTERTQREERAEVVDLSKVEAAFARAKSTGLQWPRLRLGKYNLKPAGERSANPGAIYVTARPSEEADGSYLGKVIGGKFSPSRECTPDMQKDLMVMMADPAKAAVTFGRLTGHCAICGRLLEKGESVERGIGPICAERFGW